MIYIAGVPFVKPVENRWTTLIGCLEQDCASQSVTKALIGSLVVAREATGFAPVLHRFLHRFWVRWCDLS